MPDPSLIASYLAKLARQLPGSAESRARVLDEVRDHLLAAAAREQTLGASKDEAARRAVARFGGPETVNFHFVALYEERGAVMREVTAKIVGWLGIAASAYYAWFFLAVRPAQGTLVGAVLLAGSGARRTAGSPPVHRRYRLVSRRPAGHLGGLAERWPRLCPPGGDLRVCRSRLALRQRHAHRIHPTDDPGRSPRPPARARH